MFFVDHFLRFLTAVSWSAARFICFFFFNNSFLVFRQLLFFDRNIYIRLLNGSLVSAEETNRAEDFCIRSAKCSSKTAFWQYVKYEESHIAVFLLLLSWLMIFFFFLRWKIYLLERTADPIEFSSGKLAFFSLPHSGIYETPACECLIFSNVAEHNGR